MEAFHGVDMSTKAPRVTIMPFPEVAINSRGPLQHLLPLEKMEVKVLCDSALKAWNKRDLLELELAAGTLAFATKGTTTRRVSQHISTKVALDTFLASGLQCDDARLTPKQQTIFALDIASSILQFQQTSWFTTHWDSKTIKFLMSDGTIVGAFIEQDLGVPPQNSTTAVLSSGPDPHTALLELAILLLEIWHHKPFEAWASKAQEEVQTQDQRRIAAIRWLQATSERLPLDYLTAIEQCLAICSGRLRNWGDDKFHRDYCENILKPLLESCKAWVR